MGYLFVLLLAFLLLWLGIRQFKINRKRITEGVIVKAPPTIGISGKTTMIISPSRGSCSD